MKLKIFEEGVPIIADIASGSPRVSNGGTPFPDFLLTPIANRIKDGSPTFVQGLSHRVVPKFCRNIGCMTVIIFEVVDSKIKKKVLPAGVGLGINFFKSITSRSSLACLTSRITVQSKLKPFAVDIFCEGRNSRRKFFFVLNDHFCCVVSVDLPAVVKIYVDVTFFIQAQFNNFVCSFLDNCLIDVAIEMVPTVPSHLWGPAKTVVNGITESEK